MEDILNHPPKESLYYEDESLYVCLAKEPKSKGHSVVVWKKEVKDLERLSFKDYDYLMNVVQVTRDILKEFYKTNKVYLVYMDETDHVHWHLIPRYKERGFDVLNNVPEELHNFSDVSSLSSFFKKKLESLHQNIDKML